MTTNKIHTWRHGLHATEASVTAIKNTVSNFHNAAFVIQNPNTPVEVNGNTAISKNPKDNVILLDGKAMTIAGNELKTPNEANHDKQ